MTSTHASIIPADASESRHGSQQDHRISELEDELSQMEAVMLARIQHEEMLESQLEDMKQALRDARRGDAVKPAVAAAAGRTSPDGRASVLSTKSSAPSEQRLDDDDDKCEVCGAQHAVQVSICLHTALVIMTCFACRTAPSSHRPESVLRPKSPRLRRQRYTVTIVNRPSTISSQ